MPKVLDVKDDETAISQTEGQRGSGSPGGVDVTVRRSTRKRREPAKYQSPCASPIFSKRSGPSKTSTSSQSDAAVSSQSETDSERVQVKKKKVKMSKKTMKGKAKTMKSTEKKQTGPKMTEYERMIQKNIEERNAFLANLMKGEDSSFEEEKPVGAPRKKKVKGSPDDGQKPGQGFRKKRGRDSSTNDEEEIEQPKKKRKVPTRKRKASFDDEEKEEKVGVGYNTRSRGAKSARGIYKEHGSSGGENDTLSDPGDVSDDGGEETSGERDTRRYKKTRSTGIVTRRTAMKDQRGANQNTQDPGHIERGSVGVENSGEDGEDSEDDDEEDDDYVVDTTFAEEEGTFVDTDEAEDNNCENVTPPKKNMGIDGEDRYRRGESDLKTPEAPPRGEDKIIPLTKDDAGDSNEGTDQSANGQNDIEPSGKSHETEVSEKIIVSIKNDNKVNGDEGNSDEEKKDANGKSTPKTPELKENGNIDRTEESNPKSRKFRSEENKENSIPEETEDVLSPGE